MEKFFNFFPKMIEKVLTKWKKCATIIPETERKPQKCGLDKKKNQPEKKQSLEEYVMNRTFENRGKTNFDTYRNEAYGQDYLVLALLAVNDKALVDGQDAVKIAGLLVYIYVDVELPPTNVGIEFTPFAELAGNRGGAALAKFPAGV